MTEEITKYSVSPNQQINSRIIRLKLVDGSQVNGQVNLNRDTRYDRLSDLVSSEKEPFLILFNASIHQIDLDNPIKHKTLFVNKNHIIWAAPDDDQK